MKNFFVFCVLIFASNSYSDENSTPCGLKGTIAQRIKNCSKYPDSVKESQAKFGEGFYLVTRYRDLKSFSVKEIYKEFSTGLLWSPFLSQDMDHHKALTACKSDLAEISGITEVSWGLPTVKEFKQANKSDIRNAHRMLVESNEFTMIWVTDLQQGSTKEAWYFNGLSGLFGQYPRHKKLSVLCVGRK
jgi:hypothetical protein